MCYFLYGAVNDGVSLKEYHEAIKDSAFHFRIGSAKDVNEGIKNCDDGYRITLDSCDCDTAIGQKDSDRKELKKFEKFLLNLRDVRGIKYMLLSKNWWRETNTRQETVHIDDIDLLHFLAGIEDNCLYKIELYKRYH